MARFDWNRFIFIMGGLYIAYLVLKSWGIITTTSKTIAMSPDQYVLANMTNMTTVANLNSNWMPLTQEQITKIENLTRQ